MNLLVACLKVTLNKHYAKAIMYILHAHQKFRSNVKKMSESLLSSRQLLNLQSKMLWFYGAFHLQMKRGCRGWLSLCSLSLASVYSRADCVIR